MTKKPTTFFRKFSKNNSRDSPNRRNLRDFSQKQKPRKEERRSFNKKIVIQKKQPKSYKDSFGSITSNVKFTKKSNKTKLTENQTYHKFRGYDIIITKEDWSDVKSDYKEKTKHIDKDFLDNIEKSHISHFSQLYSETNPMIDDEIVLQRYLLMNYCDIKIAYQYFKETKLTLSEFIQKYSLDNLIKLKGKEEKDFVKLSRNITRKFNSIMKLIEKQKNNKKLNKQELTKLQKKNEFTFEKRWIDFFKKHFY